MKKYFLRFYSVLLSLSLVAFSCESFLDIDPPKTQLVSKNVFENDASAVSTIHGLYSELVSYGFASGGSGASVTLYAGLSADEFLNFAAGNDDFYHNSLTPTSYTAGNIWGTAYQAIYRANAILEGVASSSSLSVEVRNQLNGEAKFIRAFAHHYLVNLYGDVPLHTTTDYELNSTGPKQSIAEIYEQIEADLKDAKVLLAEDYSFSGGERIRPSRYAAAALLARVYLYSGKWSQAAEEASAVIASEHYTLSENPNDVFLANSSEAIWQLPPVEPGYGTNEARLFIYEGSPLSSGSVTLANELAASFEDSDLRLGTWITSREEDGVLYYFPRKYKEVITDAPTEYSMVLRLAESYLIRAEARAQQNDIEGSTADLDMIRVRSGLAKTTASTKDEMLNAIEEERNKELFSEWGHRWFDLKRLGKADEVLGEFKGSYWQPTDIYYPIPIGELQNNHEITQNPGY